MARLWRAMALSGFASVIRFAPMAFRVLVGRVGRGCFFLGGQATFPLGDDGRGDGIADRVGGRAAHVEELVDAALVGFDRRELVTIPPLHVAQRWDALDGARLGLLSDIRQARAAERYRPQA